MKFFREIFRSRPEAVETYCERKWSDILTKISKQLVVATATEYNHNRKNYDPGTVVIKDVA